MAIEYERLVWAQDLSKEFSYDYWNDSQQEAAKAFNISDGNYEKVLAHLVENGVLSHVNEITRRIKLQGAGLDLGAGICWLEPILFSRFPAIQKIHCVEFSRHRLFDLAPRYLNHHAVAREKCVLCLGTFSDIKLEDHSLDFVVTCQSLHHAKDPAAVLAEIRRLLKRGGLFVALAEHFRGPFDVLVKYAKHCALYGAKADYRRKRGRLFLSAEELFFDPVKGDTHFDEGQMYRTIRTQQFKIVSALKARKRLSIICRAI